MKSTTKYSVVLKHSPAYEYYVEMFPLSEVHLTQHFRNWILVRHQVQGAKYLIQLGPFRGASRDHWRAK